MSRDHLVLEESMPIRCGQRWAWGLLQLPEQLAVHLRHEPRT